MSLFVLWNPFRVSYFYFLLFGDSDLVFGFRHYGICDDYLHVMIHGSPSKGLIVGGAFCIDEGCGTWVKGEG